MSINHRENITMCSYYMNMMVKKVPVENSFDVGLSVFLASLFGVFSTDSIVFNLVLLQGCDHPKETTVCVIMHS